MLGIESRKNVGGVLIDCNRFTQCEQTKNLGGHPPATLVTSRPKLGWILRVELLELLSCSGCQTESQTCPGAQSRLERAAGTGSRNVQTPKLALARISLVNKTTPFLSRLIMRAMAIEMPHYMAY